MSHSPKQIIIIGAGPGGLASAMLLSHRGFQVTVFEKESQVGGRNAALRLGDFLFDTGPTFLMMKFVLDEIFEEVDRRSQDYLEFKRLEPMYRLQFHNLILDPTTNHDLMQTMIDTNFPGNPRALEKYLHTEKRRFELMYPCLQKDYSTWTQMISRDFRRALPHLSLGRSLMQVLRDYYQQEQLQLSFTFQSKYLGMSPWECPGAFGILSFIEHAFGIYHTRGGLAAIPKAMARVVQEKGGKILLSTPVKKLLLAGRRVKGVELDKGDKVYADAVIINADFGYAMTQLVPSGVLKKYSPQNISRKKFSCSTFMLYLGLNRVYDLPHHTILFSRDYRTNIADIFQHKRLSSDPSLYLRNASVSDSSLAPQGKSAVYILVPVPNQSSGLDWEKERSVFRQQVLNCIQSKTCMHDLEQHIEVEHIITPSDWENQYHVFRGATFNLAHNLSQMLYFRPRNQFEELDHCYLVGGGTHPGSGLPTIYESGRITANMISKIFGVPFVSKNTQI